MGSTDTISWPKDFLELKRLDNFLRCGICYDYMKTSMMTSCCHNYCSLCIRKYMQYKSVCPACLEETFEINLRNNRALDEIILLFTAIRDKILRRLRLAAIHVPKPDEPDPTCNTPCSSKFSKETPDKTESKERSVVRQLDKVNDISKDADDDIGVFTMLTSPVIGKSPKPTSNGQVTPVTKIPSIFYSPKKAGSSVSPAAASVGPVVACPVCNVDIPERNINIHLDKCLARENAPAKCETKPLKRIPIPKRVYSMMSEKDLRKWLKMYGLNTVGEKKILINRLQRYTVLFNSECDCDNPREVRELVRQVEKEEKDEKLAASGLGIVRKLVSRTADPKFIEIENKKYIEKNKKNFESLISAMRERDQKYIKPTRFSNRINSDDSEIDDDLYHWNSTELVSNSRKSPSDKSQHNGCNYFEPEIIIHSENSSDVVEIRSESPDLSNAKPTTGTSSAQKLKENNRLESHFSIKTCPSVSASLNKSPDFDECNSKGLETVVETPNCETDNSKILCKQADDDSDNSSSNESFSLLANHNNTEVKANTSKETSKEIAVPESQIIDPDFVITDSELNCDYSEDLFETKKKRARPNSSDNSFPKRVLRKRTKR